LVRQHLACSILDGDLLQQRTRQGAIDFGPGDGDGFRWAGLVQRVGDGDSQALGGVDDAGAGQGGEQDCGDEQLLT